MCQTKPSKDGVQDKKLDSSDKGSIYDRAMSPNDLKIMAPVRRWEKRMGFITPLRWDYVFFLTLHHLITVVLSGISLYNGWAPKWQTVVFAFILLIAGQFGATAGAHRYWSHKAFKANMPLRFILTLFFCITGQGTLLEWVGNHRVHHKCSDTDADPHDTQRGFFYTHIGCLMMEKHPRFHEEFAKIDTSDLTNDPFLMFQTKYVAILNGLFSFILPPVANVMLFDESWYCAILWQAFLRNIVSLNCTLSVNSFAHLWGNKPYNESIRPVENAWISVFNLGEGWHNYHHTFPWDYKASELPYKFNITTLLLDFFAKIGWAYDLKTASPELIKKTAFRKGEIKLN